MFSVQGSKFVLPDLINYQVNGACLDANIDLIVMILGLVVCLKLHFVIYVCASNIATMVSLMHGQ